MDLNYLQLGDGPPLVLFHGLFGSGDNWLSIARKLQGWNVYLPDLRNHGSSPWSERFTIPDLAQDAAEFIERHGLENPVLMGHSLGGKVVMELALQRPELPRGLVVVDMAPRAYEPQYDGFVQAMRAVDLGRISNRSEAGAQLGAAVRDQATLLFLLKSLVHSPDGWRWKLNLEALEDHYDEIWRPLKTGRIYRGPAFFFAGGDSDYVQTRDSQLIHDLFPLASIEVLAGAGHWLHSEKPAEFLKILEKALAAIKGSGQNG